VLQRGDRRLLIALLADPAATHENARFVCVEIYQYVNARRALLTFEIAGGLAELVRVGEVHVSADDERRYRLTPAGAQAEEAYRLKPPTARQVQFLARLEAGLSPEDIAQELG
jgi:DNA-binding NarL/FixJ family response regulator